jgi:2-hydroxychromene-2-carboxylate isomerase
MVLYIDPASPYAYLAAERAERVLGAMPRIEPVFLYAIFQERGWGSWAHMPTRPEHVAEIERRAAAYGLPPVTWPANWPPNSVNASRSILWAERHDRAADQALALFRAAFAEGRDASDLDVIREIATSIGLPAAEFDPADFKDELRTRTAQAWADGVMGVPTLRVDDRLIYGDDRLDEAA